MSKNQVYPKLLKLEQVSNNGLLTISLTMLVQIDGLEQEMSFIVDCKTLTEFVAELQIIRDNFSENKICINDSIKIRHILSHHEKGKTLCSLPTEGIYDYDSIENCNCLECIRQLNRVFQKNLKLG